MLLLLAMACCLPIPGLSGKSEPAYHPITVSEPRATPVIRQPHDEPVSGDPNEPPVAMSKDQCEDLDEGSRVEGPDCITREVQCNTVIYDHTLGGTQAFDSAFYDRHKCTPRTTNHDSGNERTYLLHMPDGDHRVVAWLDTPCADLDLTLMTTLDKDRCPTMDSLVKVCDMWPKPGTKREHVEFATQGATDVLIVVEGKNNAEGAFAVTLQCKDGLY